MLVGRCDLDDCDVQRELPGSKQARDLREEDRRKIGTALVDRPAHIRANEQRVMPKRAIALRCRSRVVAGGEHVDDLDCAGEICSQAPLNC